MLVAAHGARRRLAGLLSALALAAGLLVLPALSAPAAAADPCGPGGNEITCENSKPGTPKSEWDDMWGAGDESIQGFSTEISVDVGDRVDFKIDTDASAYTIEIFRIGYYQGHGARRITSVQPKVPLPQHQPQCISDLSTELLDCGNWSVSASWNVPSTAVSGVYVARLERTDTGGASHITFVVRDESSTSDVVFQTSDTTWQAYNTYGGSNFYWGGANGRAYKLSYNRPMATRGGVGGRDFFFSNEYPMVRFLEKNGYDVSYLSGLDTHLRGDLLTQHDVFLSVGHDEYWSGPQRDNVEAARDAGVHLQFLSGNEMYWRVRWEPSIDGTQTANRTLVTYKETWAHGKNDPSPEWTGTWRDPRFAPPSQGGGLPENGLTGTAYMVNHDDLSLTVPAAQGRMRLWRHTGLASMAPGTEAVLAPHTIGYESNEDLDNGHRPEGLIRLSTTEGETPEYLQDYGNTVAPGRTTHHVTLYKAPSGALVFSAGTVQWTWGLDGEHDSPFPDEPPDPRMQQAQVNLFADMGVQPASLDPALTQATRSTDTTAPTVAITSPNAGATRSNGAQVTVSGSASDVGGRVAGVEVSTDGGDSWHPAEGTTSWSYTYTQHGQGPVDVRARAVDDSANIGPAATRGLTVTCPCSVFGTQVPEIPASDDGGAVELGLRLSPTTDGFISGVRFYKGAGNGGTHTGSLWSADGELLARGTFTDETTTGWQELRFTSVVPVSAGTTYVVSYTAPQGRYAIGTDAFYEAPLVAPPLRVEGGFGATPAGVYGAPGSFPANSHASSNYYVDAVFTVVDDSPLVATEQWPLPGSTSVPADTTVSATFSKPVTPGSAVLAVEDALGDLVPGTTSYDAATRTVTFTPDQPLAGFVEHTVQVSGVDALDQQVSGGGQWSFTTAKPPGPEGVCPCGLFDDTTVPAVLEDSDRSAVTLGVRFSPTADGQVTGIQFYKGPRNTGTHTGALWSASGELLAAGTFGNESTSGWQTLVLSEPVEVSRAVEYVASYRTEVGRYSVTPNGFASQDLSRRPLNVSSTSGAYTYGSGFPAATSPSNYLVDVVFLKAPDPLEITARAPASGAVEVPRGTKVVVELSTPVVSGFQASVSAGGPAVPGSTQLSTDGTRITFTPTDRLPAGAEVTVTLTGLTSVEDVTLPPQSWTFTTRSGDDPATQSLFGPQLPAVAAADESAPVELGTAFTPTRDGRVTGVRFFKGAGNTGVHRGSLWSESGQLLAQVRFVGETDSGWQQALFSAPVPVSAGTTYVVSYHAPRGHYSYTSGFFSEPFTSGDLSAPAATAGRYLYGDGGFPTYSWGASSYFVDVVFEKAPTALTVTQRTPAPGAQDVGVETRPRITFSDPVDDGWEITVSPQGQGSPVAGEPELSADGRTIRFVPDAPLAASTTYRVVVSGLESTDGVPLADQEWTFTTEADATPAVSLFEGLTPGSHSSDTDPLELGTAFVPQVAGKVTGVRFYKGPGNGGTHTGSLWSADGDRLATVTFTGESASGWQTALLESPVDVTAGETYVVSYYSPTGRYSVTGGFFADPFTAGPLTAPAGQNGRFRYGTGGGFPTGSWNSSNYFVDVVFKASP